MEIDMYSIKFKEQSLDERDSKTTIVKTKQPNGRYCNPYIDQWCENLISDYCTKYMNLLFTYGGLEYPFTAQIKCKQCIKDLKNGEPKQVSLLELLND